MRKLSAVCTAAVLLALVLAAQVNAAPLLGFDPTGQGNYSVRADLWTALTDTALRTGFVPGTTVPPPYSTTFIFQNRIGGMTDAGAVVTPTNINRSFELTIETSIPERVTGQRTFTDTAGRTHEVATFSNGENRSAVLNIFLDRTPDANPNRVAGYGDGIRILSAHLQSVTASADTVRRGPGAGIGTGSFDALYLIDSIDRQFLSTSGNILGLRSTGTINVPGFYTPASMWNGTPTDRGTAMKLDSSFSFSTAGAGVVPEPSTVLLLGAGLLAGAAYLRVRRS